MGICIGAAESAEAFGDDKVKNVSCLITKFVDIGDSQTEINLHSKLLELCQVG